MAKVLVTGVAGRVGSTLARHLVRAGYEVRGMVRPGGRVPHSAIAGEVELVEASLTDTDALTQAVAHCDIVVHLAAQMVIGDTPVEEFFDVNVGGTLRLLEASAAQHVRRFVLASTDNVYRPGDPPSEPIAEAHPQMPGDYYGTSKVLAEQLVRNYYQLYGVDYSILRLGSVIAPNEAPVLFRADWTRAFLAGQVAAGRRSNLWPLFADCGDIAEMIDAATRDHDDNPAVVVTGPAGEPWAIHLTDVRDAVAGIMLGIEHPRAVGDSFNIVGPHSTTFAEAATAFGKHCDLDQVDVQLPVKLAFEISTAKAKRVLGYEPAWDFDAMLERGLVRGAGEAQDYVPVGEA